MLISLNWLKDYVNLSKISNEQIGSMLTLKTVELEKIYRFELFLKNIVIAEVLKIENHPNADRLKIVTVLDDRREYRVVCGGTNLYEKMLVAFAKPQAQVYWHGEEKPTVLKPVAIRGEKSEGMICAGSEIKLPFLDQGQSTIADLSFTKAKRGTPLEKLIDSQDALLEIDNKSMNHRPDLWGHYGISRELAAIFNLKLSPLKFSQVLSSSSSALSISIASSKICPRYSAIILENIKIAPSPLWMQARLFAVGIKPVNNVVDITNYVMLETGQPLHAFDFSKISSKIKIRLAKEKEKIITLDNIERTLSKDDIVISDQDKAIALAGIMGGKNSQINSETTSIVLESANFNPVMIRRTANRQNLRTEAAQRFEKHQDPEFTIKALERAFGFMRKIIPQIKTASPVFDEKKYSFKPLEIKLSLDFIQSRIGANLSQKDILKILKSLDFTVKRSKNEFKVKVPSFRATKDISLPEDLIEEIARLYGYDNIEGVNPKVELKIPPKNHARVFSKVIKNILANLGFSEVYNYSFLGEKDLEKTFLQKDEHVKIINSLSQDCAFLRNNGVASLLKNTQANLRFFEEIKLFEFQRAYLKEKTGDFTSPKKQEKLFKEVHFLSVCFLNPKNKEPFFELKKVLIHLFSRFHLNPSFRLPTKTKGFAHPQKSAQIIINQKKIGEIFEINPLVAKEYKIKKPLAYFEINFNELLPFLILPALQFKKIPKFQNITVDLSLEIDKKSNLSFSQIEKTIQNNSSLIESIAPKALPFSKNETNVYTLELSYRQLDHQVTAHEYAQAHRKVIAALKNLPGCSLQGEKQIISTLDKLITQS
jgi:phenylalanyl-tRNA synthetase beta chain